MTYTPTTSNIRDNYAAAVCLQECTSSECPVKAGFDRWYAEELRKAKHEAWDEHIKNVWGADSYEYYELSQENPYTEES